MGCSNSKSGGHHITNDNQLPGKERNRLSDLTCKNNVRDIYTIGKLIGTGGFAQVKLAWLKEDKNQKYAVKIIEKDKIKTKQYILIREIEILMKLDHPNIIKFHEIYEDEKYFYIVQEYCCGGELLKRLVDMKHFDEFTTYKTVQKIMSAVHHMHVKGIVHRDLKPENILYQTTDPNSEIKIIDFGLSNKFQPETNLTTMVGTPLYVSPQVLSGKYSQSCDVWSIGIIMYVMLCGAPPFYSDNKNQIFDMIENEDPPFNDPLWQSISPEAKDLINKMLIKEEEKRITLKQTLSHPWITKMQQNQTYQTEQQAEKKIEPKVLGQLKNFHGFSKFKQQVMKKIVNQLNANEIKELTEVFRAIDKENTGLVSLAELRQAMKESKIEITDEELDDLFSMLSENQIDHQSISYTSFIQATLDVSKYLTKERLWSLFKYFDNSGNNFITPEDMLEIMRRHGSQATIEEVKAMIDEVDQQHQGKISFEIFKKLMNEDSFSPEK